METNIITQGELESDPQWVRIDDFRDPAMIHPGGAPRWELPIVALDDGLVPEPPEGATHVWRDPDYPRWLAE